MHGLASCLYHAQSHRPTSSRLVAKLASLRSILTHCQGYMYLGVMSTEVRVRISLRVTTLPALGLSRQGRDSPEGQPW